MRHTLGFCVHAPYKADSDNNNNSFNTISSMIVIITKIKCVCFKYLCYFTYQQCLDVIREKVDEP